MSLTHDLNQSSATTAEATHSASLLDTHCGPIDPAPFDQSSETVSHHSAIQNKSRPLRKSTSHRVGKARTPSLLGVALIAIAGTAIGYQVFLNQFDQRLRKTVLGHLNELFPHADIELGHVTQNSSGDVIVTHLEMLSPTSKSSRPVFTAESVVIQGDLRIQDLIQDQIRVAQVALTGVQCDIWPIGEQQWSIASIVPKPRPSQRPPQIIFNDADIRLHKSAAADAAITSFRIDHGTLVQSVDEAGGPEPRQIHANFNGRCANTIDHFQVVASLNRKEGSSKVHGSFDHLHLSRNLLERLPERISVYLMQLAGLECYASARFQVEAVAELPIDFRVLGTIQSGRLRDPRLPYPLENLQSDFSCENSKVQLRNMSAESGATRLQLNCDLYGLGANSPLNVQAGFQKLDLDQRLYRSLPPGLQEHWDLLELSGQVSGELKLLFDGNRWTPSLSVQCEGVNLRPWLFPYPISGVSGLVTYQDNKIQSNYVQGRAGGQPVQASFLLQQSVRLADGRKPWFGRLDCRSEGPISIDEQLVSALTPSDRDVPTGAEGFVRSLRPSGTIQLTGATFYRPNPEDIWHKKIQANVYSGSILYDNFRYPIYDIRGHISCEDDNWWIDQFEGRNDSGRILCSGNWMTKSGDVPFDLRFEAFAVPIEEELKLALPAETQFVWNELQPLGAIDRVEVRLQRLDGDHQVSTNVKVVEESRSNDASGRSLRLRPKAFPYWLTDVDCQISYSPGLVLIQNASGVNGASRIAIRGMCEPVTEGRWKATVDWLPQTRLLVDSQLLKALPDSIRKSLVKIDFRGPISLLGQSEILFADARNQRIATAWNCRVAVEDGQLGDGRYLGALRGSMTMQGYSDGNNVKATGSIALDALTVLGIPLTRLTGPFALLDSNLYFGKQVAEVLPPTGGEAESELTANALTGKLSVSGYGKLDSGKFVFESKLKSANLNLLLKDLGVENATAEAICDAQLNFQGVPWNPQTYVGDGHVHLSNAQLYELPFMMRLMSVASVSASSDTAFQTADIHFTIDGDRIPLQVACDGDILRLRGEGETNLRRDIRLDLYSYVGRRMPLQQVVSPFLSENRFATFMLIEVDGTLNNPIMRPRAFPQIEDTIQQLFPDLADFSQ